MLHILDDFLFLGPPNSAICHSAMNQFLFMCEILGVPIKSEKTEGPTTCIVFLGIELDTVKFEARFPQEIFLKNQTCTRCSQKIQKDHTAKSSVFDILNNIFSCFLQPLEFFSINKQLKNKARIVISLEND